MSRGSQLKLLYLLPAAGFGGAERQGVYHLAELPRHGVDVTAVVGPGDPVMRALREANVHLEPFRHFPDREHGPLTSGDIFRSARSVTALWRSVSEIERRVRGQRLDLIFANRTYAWLVAALLSRRIRVPYVVRVGSRLAHPALALGLDVLDRVLPPAAAFCNCRAVEDDVASHLRCPAYPLPNAIDVDRFAPGPPGAERAARIRLGLPLDAPLVGLAARPAPEKGFDFFERLVARVHDARPGTRFFVAGEFGWRRRYEERIFAAGLGEVVRFLGRVDAISEFLRAMDVVILTSRERSIEASPNALLEALALGRPVVATAVGGVPELVRHGREGFLAPPDDVPSFAAGLVELLDNPRLRREMGRAGSAVALRRRVPDVVSELARNLEALLPSAAHPESRAA